MNYKIAIINYHGLLNLVENYAFAVARLDTTKVVCNSKLFGLLERCDTHQASFQSLDFKIAYLFHLSKEYNNLISLMNDRFQPVSLSYFESLVRKTERAWSLVNVLHERSGEKCISEEKLKVVTRRLADVKIISSLSLNFVSFFVPAASLIDLGFVVATSIVDAKSADIVLKVTDESYNKLIVDRTNKIEEVKESARSKLNKSMQERINIMTNSNHYSYEGKMNFLNLKNDKLRYNTALEKWKSYPKILKLLTRLGPGVSIIFLSESIKRAFDERDSVYRLTE